MIYTRKPSIDGSRNLTKQPMATGEKTENAKKNKRTRNGNRNNKKI